MAKKDEKPREIDEHDDGHAEARDVDAAATALTRAAERRARMRERRISGGGPASAHDKLVPAAKHGQGHGHGHDHDREEPEDDSANDPTWWIPHAVLGTLVLVGILGFLGLFNGVAAKLGYGGMPAGTASAQAETVTTGAAANMPKPPAPTGMQPPGPPRETFGAKHILVMHKDSMRVPPGITRTKEEAKARAEEARKKAVDGAKFEDLVKEYSDEPGAGARGGDLGQFPKGRMVPAFQEGLEKTKVGGLSELVETQFGYHIILRTK